MSRTKPLHQLLHAADQAPPPPRSSVAEFSVQVRRQTIRRRFQFRGVMAMLMLVAAVAGARLQSYAPQVASTIAPGPAPLADELEAINRQADQRMARIEQIMRAAQSPARRSKLSINPELELQLARDRAALILLRHGEQSAQPSPEAEGHDQYQRVVELFPDSASANVARARIAGQTIERNPL